MTSDWRDYAACRGHDTANWYPEEDFRIGINRIARNRAVRICLGCPVKNQCADWAIDNDEHLGIFGGLTAKERQRMVSSTGRWGAA
jgi:WhiB family redox-sensing transcriptional regulator